MSKKEEIKKEIKLRNTSPSGLTEITFESGKGSYLEPVDSSIEIVLDFINLYKEAYSG